MIFQWDEAKNEKNIRRHGIAFEDAQYVFADPLAVSRDDHFEDEDRWQIMGHIGGMQVILAVYTMRQPNSEPVIRIISARKATPQERRDYENGTWFSRNE